MNKKQKKVLVRILITAALLALLNLVQLPEIPAMILYLAAYLIIGYDILRKAGKGILNGRVFDENFLMAVATIGAVALAIISGSGDFNEAVLVMLFYQVGELFQSYAVGKSRRSIASLMDIRPDYANIEVDGKLEQVDPDEVEAGSVIVVQPGEKVPIDGVVISGSSSANRPCRRYWSLLKAPARASRARSSLSRALQGSTPPSCATRRLRLRYCRRLCASCSWVWAATGPTGSIAR